MGYSLYDPAMENRAAWNAGLKVGAKRALTNLSSMAGSSNAIVASLLLQGLDIAEATRFAQRWAAVSPEAAAAVARRYITPERTSLIVVGKASEFVEDLRKVRPDLIVIPAAELNLSSAALDQHSPMVGRSTSG